MSSDRSPVFVVGCGRSGTTLLYSVLLSSGEFPLYEAESRILECASRYGSLQNRRAFDRFLDDFMRARQFRRSGLDPVWFRRAAMRQCTSYLGFLRFFMERIASSQNKKRWAEKSPNHVFFIRDLACEFPRSRFIHVVRDGRDVAVSQRHLGWLSKYSEDPRMQLIWGGKDWEYMVRTARRQGVELGDRYMEVRYERLVSEPEPTLAGVSEFLSIELTRADVEACEIGALKRSNTAFSQRAYGLSVTAVDRYLEALEERERRSLEWSIGRTLREFGYAVPAQVEMRPDLRLLAHSFVAPLALRAKRWLNRHTFLGRLGSKPLEIGLD